MGNIFDLNISTINRNVKNSSGVYLILWYINDKPKPINRFIKTDDMGIISIGSSDNLNRRLKQFIKGRETGSGHSSANRLWWYALEDENMLGKMQLKFVFKYVDNYEEEESKLLIGYSDVFGELPPMNHQDAKNKYSELDPIVYPQGFIW